MLGCELLIAPRCEIVECVGVFSSSVRQAQSHGWARHVRRCCLLAFRPYFSLIEGGQAAVVYRIDTPQISFSFLYGTSCWYELCGGIEIIVFCDRGTRWLFTNLTTSGGTCSFAIVSVQLYGSIIGVSYALCGGCCQHKAVLAFTV